MIIENIRTREQAMNFLEGYAQERKEELDVKHVTKGLVKSYLLETVPSFFQEPNVELVFKNAGVRLDKIDETLYKVWDTKQNKQFGFLEKLIPRHPVLYTMEDTKVSDPWVRNLVNSTHELDRLWISGWTFEKLWQKVLEINPERRYGRLAFEYQSIFEVDSEEVEEDEAVDELEKEDEPEEKAELYKERRASRFMMVDKLEIIKNRLPKLQEIYYPLYSISQLRFPSAGRGGHDFYHNGKVTNRSDSFADHRAHLLYVLKIYKSATEATEQKAWYSIEKTTLQVQGKFTTLHGAPIVMKFREPLSAETFKKWITSTFQRKINKFRLWGNPIPVGPKKVHIYGADRHLWQPIFLEITDKHVIAILPKGTCGNTIHRLVTNIQRYVDAGVDVWIGDQNYKDLIASAINKKGIKYEGIATVPVGSVGIMNKKNQIYLCDAYEFGAIPAPIESIVGKEVIVQKLEQDENPILLYYIPWDPNVSQSDEIRMYCEQGFCERIRLAFVTRIGRTSLPVTIEIDYEDLLNEATYKFYERWKSKNTRRALRRSCRELITNTLQAAEGHFEKTVLPQPRKGLSLKINTDENKEAIIDSITKFKRGKWVKKEDLQQAFLPIEDDV